MPGGSRPTAWSHCYRPARRRPPSATWLASRRAADGRNLDEVFEDMFRERTPEELEALKAKYATKGDVLEAETLIAAKARDMLRHYVENHVRDHRRRACEHRLPVELQVRVGRVRHDRQRERVGRRLGRQLGELYQLAGESRQRFELRRRTGDHGEPR